LILCEDLCLNSYLIIYLVPPEPIRNPCVPSPCGPNSQCQVNGNSPSCSCALDYIGSPPNCRPECISNNECAYHLACINLKCKDPCPGLCALNAICKVISHTPRCSCPPGYNGDPFTQCILKQGKYILSSKLKIILSSII